MRINPAVLFCFLLILFSCSDVEENQNYLTVLNSEETIYEFTQSNPILKQKKFLWKHLNQIEFDNEKKYIDLPLAASNTDRHERVLVILNKVGKVEQASLWIFESDNNIEKLYSTTFHEILAKFDGDVYYNDLERDAIQVVRSKTGKTNISDLYADFLFCEDIFGVENCPPLTDFCTRCHWYIQWNPPIPYFPYVSPPPNPCRQMNQLALETRMISKLKDLKTKTSSNKEYASFVHYTSPMSFSSYITGTPGSGEINFPLPAAGINGLVHSHYNGLLSIFSGSDVRAIYELYKHGKIKGIKKFVFIVVTSNTTYALMVDSTGKFNTFGQNFLSTDEKFQAFELLFRAKVSTSNSNSQNEIGFANLMKGSGLKLFKGNPITFSTWTPITTNSAGNGIINDNCN